MLRGMGWQPGKGIGKNEKYELNLNKSNAMCFVHALITTRKRYFSFCYVLLLLQNCFSGCP